MALTAGQIVNQMLTQLRALDPAVSAEVGTPERKILEAGAEVAAQIEADLEALDAQHDIDTMVGGRLDAFLALFGFGRQRSIAATGTVTFSRLTPATVDITIPQGTQVVAKQTDSAYPSLTFVTTLTVVLKAGETSVDAPISCALPGTIGNVPADSVNTVVGSQTISGISRVTNAAATNGGLDGESDADFKIRFKNTVFRNISGTTDQYLALAVSSPYVTKANILGPMSRWQERIQVPQGAGEDPAAPNALYDDADQTTDYDSGGTIYPHKRTTAPSTIPYSKYTYSYNYYVTNGEFGTDTTFYRPNVDFVFNNEDANSNQPTVTVINLYDPEDNPDGTLRPGDIVLLEHAYMSAASRNRIATESKNDIVNCVDIFIDGQFPSSASSIEIMPGANNVFTNSPSNFAYASNFKRNVDGSTPALTSRFHPLFWQPVMDVPDTIVINDNRYYKAKYKIGNEYFYDLEQQIKAHYFVITDITEHYGTIRARNGIEWRSVFANSDPADGELIDNNADPGDAEPATAKTGESFVLENYYYDRNISDLQAIVDQHKQVTTDVLVHQSRVRNFKLYITVMYSRASTPDTVDSAIADAVNNFFKSQYFGSAIQMSDILQTIHNVQGVDNVRWTADSKPDDIDYTVDGEVGTPTHWIKVEEVRANGTEIATSGVNSLDRTVYDSDFFLRDDELAALADTDASITAGLVIQRRAQNTFNS